MDGEIDNHAFDSSKKDPDLKKRKCENPYH